MPTADVIAFLSLIVGLSAYIATIRLRLIDRIAEAKKSSNTDQVRKLKIASRWLTLADAPLIMSGVLLYLHGFWKNTRGLWCYGPEAVAPGWMLSVSIILFTFAIAVLVLHHIFAWWKSVSA